MELKYKPPLDWPALLGFLEPRAIRWVERVEASSLRLRRTLRLGGGVGWLEAVARPASCLVEIRLAGDAGFVSSSGEIEAKARRVFDLDCPVEDVEARLGKGSCHRVPGAWDDFEMGVRAILGQQVTVKAAHTLAGRLAEKWGEALPTPWEEVSRVFPTAKAVAGLEVEELRGIGLTMKRAETLAGFARWHCLEAGARPPLLSLPGIGPWTENYVRMRSGRDKDAFPAGDLGVQKALGLEKPGSAGAAKEAERLSQVWRPYRAHAVMLLWSSLAGMAASPVQQRKSESEMDSGM